jgi:hypothetical protein
MIIIYTATQTETKQLNITNVERTQSIVYINDVVIDDIILGAGSIEYPNLRVLELNLNDGDVVSTKDNNLITYTIE